MDSTVAEDLGKKLKRYNSKTSTVTSVVNLVRSQMFHTERPLLFATRSCYDTARRAVRQRQLILVRIHDEQRYGLL